MKRNFVAALLMLPVDQTLRGFLTRAGLPLPGDLDWNDGIHTSHALIETIAAWPDAAARDALIARLNASVQLGDAAGKQAMFQIAASDAHALVGLAACKSDLQRSFWLAVTHPALFEQACEIDYLERHSTQVQQHELDICQRLDTSDAALAGLRQAISSFYQHELRCGDVCLAYVLERCAGVFLLTVHVKDLATMQLEFEGERLTRRVGNPNIHMVLEYAQTSGVARTLVRGGSKYHHMLATAFAGHLLSSTGDAQRIKPLALNLSALRQGFDVPQASRDGFVALQVKSITVKSPGTGLKIECTAIACGRQRCVTQLLHQELLNEDPLTRGWEVDAARINLYYPRKFGKSRNKVVTVEVTRRGRLNLHRFDAALQAQLEGYLVGLGILRRGQTLHAQEGPPEVSDGAPSPPAPTHRS